MVTNRGEMVLLVHGFGAKSLMMRPLANGLRRLGYRTTFWSYLSYFASISKHAKKLERHLWTLLDEPILHIVAHSMGSIVVRAALANYHPSNLGRVVLLAPPNHGSPLARIAAPVLGWLIKPAQELSGQESSLVKNLTDPSNLDVGIVGAKFDLLVPPKRTQLSSASDRIVISQTHNSLLFSRTTQTLIANYLRTGKF